VSGISFYLLLQMITRKGRKFSIAAKQRIGIHSKENL